jgi:hypothetical protein
VSTAYQVQEWAGGEWRYVGDAYTDLRLALAAYYSLCGGNPGLRYQVVAEISIPLIGGTNYPRH